jgi:hypothetical protein
MATKERFNVVFPAAVLKDLRTLVPPRKRGEFVVEATARELRRLKQQAVLERMSKEPAWKVEDHPDLATPQDIERWVDGMRAAWRRPDSYAEGDSA